MMHFVYETQRKDWEKFTLQLGEGVVDSIFRVNLVRERGVESRAIAGALSDLSAWVHQKRMDRMNALDVNRHERGKEFRDRSSCDPDGIHDRRSLLKLMSQPINPSKRSGSRKAGRRRSSKKNTGSFFDRSILEV